MSTPNDIHGFKVYGNNVPRGLRYLEKLPRQDVEDMFHSAKISADRDHHFMAHVDGRDLNYVLVHQSDGTYHLLPK